MKERKLFLMSAVLMLASGFCGCNSDSESGIQVRNVANTGCKSAETRGEDGLPWPEYIEYKSMEDGYLSIKHVNAMFNCMPGELRMEATISGNEIAIIEEDYHETDNYISASCLCPYDLYCEVGPLTAGTYTVVVYLKNYPLIEKARFTISYAKGLEGKYVISEQQQAEEETREDTKMLVSGRTWNYMSVYYNADTVYHSITIEGPVEFDGRQCYRIGQDPKLKRYFYEEGDKVYAYTIISDQGEYGWKEEFNFGIEPGYKETYTDGDMTITVRECKAVDTIVVNGVQRRRLKFGDDVWVEGIGSSTSGIYSSWGVVIGTFMGSKLLSVYDGEKCLFTEEDFY